MDNNNYSHTISYENTPWIGEDIQNITSNNNDFTGINTFAICPQTPIVPSQPNDLVNLNYLQNNPSPSAVIFYLNNSLPSGITGGYQLLSPTIDGSSGTTITTAVGQGQTGVVIQSFANTLINLNAGSFIPSGIWDMNIFANALDNNVSEHVQLFFKIFGIGPTGVETQIGPESSRIPIPYVAPPDIIQYKLSVALSYTDLSPYVALVIKLCGSNIINQDGTVITYYENPATYSHVHTTFGVYVPPSLISTNNTWIGVNTFNNSIFSNIFLQGTTASFSDLTVSGSATISGANITLNSIPASSIQNSSISNSQIATGGIGQNSIANGYVDLSTNQPAIAGEKQFTSLLSAPAGVSALFFNGGTGTFSNITATSANFSGLVTGGSFSGGTAIFGALSCSSEVDLGTLGVSGQATFGSGIAGTTASFSGLIRANGGISGTTGYFSGLVTGGSFSGGTATFGALSCTSEVDLGTLGVSGQATFGSGIAGTTASFSGLIRANGGISGTTGYFSGGVTATNGYFTSLSYNSLTLIPTIVVANGGLTGITGTFVQSGVQYTTYTYNNSGIFTVTTAPTGATMDILAIGGGGGGGGGANAGGGGGGGAGQMLFVYNQQVGVTAYNITIGQGGAAGLNGQNTIITVGGTTLISSQGGAGGAPVSVNGSVAPTGGIPSGTSSGSGGGGGLDTQGGIASISVSSKYILPEYISYSFGGGGGAAADGAGGGGGAKASGQTTTTVDGGAGGAGQTILFTNNQQILCGGGGGGAGSASTQALGGTGGGGNGAGTGLAATAGTANTGSGGGGGARNNTAGAAGGSGLVIIRFAS